MLCRNQEIARYGVRQREVEYGLPLPNSTILVTRQNPSPCTLKRSLSETLEQREYPSAYLRRIGNLDFVDSELCAELDDERDDDLDAELFVKRVRSLHWHAL